MTRGFADKSKWNYIELTWAVATFGYQHSNFNPQRNMAVRRRKHRSGKQHFNPRGGIVFDRRGNDRHCIVIIVIPNQLDIDYHLPHCSEEENMVTGAEKKVLLDNVMTALKTRIPEYKSPYMSSSAPRSLRELVTLALLTAAGLMSIGNRYIITQCTH